MSPAVDTHSLDIPPRCGDCGYELTGLPASGKCPECGGEYTPDVLVLFGWAGGQSNLATASPQRVRYLIIAQAIAIAFFALAFVLSRFRVRTIFDFAVEIFVWLGIPALLLWRRWIVGADSPGLVQARLGSGGFGRRIGVGPVRFCTWDTPHSLHVEETRPNQVRIHIKDGRFFVVKARSVDIVIQSHLPAERWREVIEAIRGKAPCLED